LTLMAVFQPERIILIVPYVCWQSIMNELKNNSSFHGIEIQNRIVVWFLSFSINQSIHKP
jgi:hypothetical protein